MNGVMQWFVVTVFKKSYTNLSSGKSLACIEFTHERYHVEGD